MKVGQKVRSDTKCSRMLEDFLQLPSKASTNLGASHCEKEAYILTLGGRIRCPRCQAKSKRTKQQCRSPAIRGKRCCRIHGGKSTGPRTQQGRNLCGAAKTLHGRETRAIRARRQQALAELKLLERMGRRVGVF